LAAAGAARAGRDGRSGVHRSGQVAIEKRTAAIESDSLSLLIAAYINSMRFSYQLEIVLQAVTSLNMHHLPAYLL